MKKEQIFPRKTKWQKLDHFYDMIVEKRCVQNGPNSPDFWWINATRYYYDAHSKPLMKKNLFGLLGIESTLTHIKLQRMKYQHVQVKRVRVLGKVLCSLCLMFYRKITGLNILASPFLHNYKVSSLFHSIYSYNI